MQLFDADWLEAAASALAAIPAVDAIDAVIDYVLAGTPEGKATIGVAIEGGVVTSVTAGKSKDPDIVISLKYPDAVSILTGELSSDAGYMNAALKVEGAYKTWMLDLRATRAAAIDALAALMAHTET